MEQNFQACMVYIHLLPAHTFPHVIIFRCERTFENYLGHARVGCLLAGKPDQVFDEPALRRAKVAIKKRLLFIPRERMFIRHPMLLKSLKHANEVPKWKLTVPWMLAAYVFMTRVPSECLPLTIGNGEVEFGKAQRTNQYYTSYLDLIRLEA